MKFRIISIIFCLLATGLFGICTGQTSQVGWSSLNMGYAELNSGATIIRSVVGQSFVGATQQDNTQVISGFLADTLFHGSPLEVKSTDELPKWYFLAQNYPNPFNPGTTIRFEIPKESHVTLKVYNMLGQDLLTLLDQVKAPGRYHLEIDGRSLASGVYFYRLTADDFVSTKRLMILK